MDIFVHPIPSWATEDAIEAEIASALHNPPVRRAGQGIINFALKIPARKDGKPLGHAYLTIPEPTTAERFLEKCAKGSVRRPVTINNGNRACTLGFKYNGFADPHKVQKLLDEPYIDLQTRWEQSKARRERLEAEAQKQREGLSARESRRRAEEVARIDAIESADSARELPADVLAELAGLAKRVLGSARRQARPKAINVGARGLPEAENEATYGRSGAWRTIQFGVVCHDGSFSIEDEERLAAPLPASLSESTQTLVFGDEDSNGVKIPYNSVIRWSILEESVTFELERPATFVRNGRVSTHWCFRKRDPDDPILLDRQRFRAAHAGSAFRVIFTTHEELDAFLLHGRRVLVRAGLPSEPRRCIRGNLLKATYFDRISALCAGLSIPLAFQIEKLFLNDLLHPVAVNDLEPLVTRSVRERGESMTAVLVMNVGLHIQRRRAMKKHGDSSYGFDLSDLRAVFIYEAKHLAIDNGKPEDLLSIGLGATFEVYNATVTPTRTLLAGPVVDTSNRVLRFFPEHSHHFLRVAFTDEDSDRFPVGRRDLRGVDSESFVHERVGGTLTGGIVVGGRKWDMLAWSGSSIRTHQCWFATPFTDDRGKRWTADLIRQSLGDFSTVEMFPARYGARLSQAFSATAPTIKLRDEWVEVIEDVESDSGHLFTDGVGQISAALMERVWQAYCLVKMQLNERRREVMASKVPSAIQVRIGGAKGVLCVNPLLEGMKVRLRPSMIKFKTSRHNDIEVATSSLHPLPTRLNRPLINALEDLGVDHDKFLSLQRLAIAKVDQARKSFRSAAELCKHYGFGPAFSSLNVFERLHHLLGLKPHELNPGGMMDRLIASSISAALGDLKRKARIPTLGPTLIGVADEFGFLKKNQVFAQVEESDGQTRVVEGSVLIGRSPTIHPGDTRMVQAMVPPKDHPLMKLRNVVVFSCEGKGRSLQSMLGGGDLDGDIYSLFEEPLLFINKNFSPGEYKQPPNKRVNRPCTVEDLADFFTDFVINDQLGIVSHLHLQISDYSELHSLDPDCVTLAALHSQAVDFCKTGQAVHRRDLPTPPSRTLRPDYLAQNDFASDVYKSKRALGYLYREIAWRDTDMPEGPQKIWVNPDAPGSSNRSASSSTSDLVAILGIIELRFPYAKPKTSEAEKAMQQKCQPLLGSFVYHLSRIAAWVPEGRRSADWLREEEIILGSPVMATTSKLKRWQDKLQSATSELVPILKHQLGVIVRGGDPTAIESTDKHDLEAKLQLRSFGASTQSRPLIRQNGPAKAAPETAGERSGLLAVVEIDGEPSQSALDRNAVEGELIPSFSRIALEPNPPGDDDPDRAEPDDTSEIQGLYAACLLGAQDPRARAFGGDTFALVALGSLLDLIDAREKRTAKQREKRKEKGDGGKRNAKKNGKSRT